MTSTFKIQIFALSALALLIFGSLPSTSASSLRVLESPTRNLQFLSILSSPYIKDYGKGNVISAGIVASANVSMLLQVNGSYNSIGAVTIIGTQNAQVKIIVNGHYNVIAGLTITASENAVLVLSILGSANSIGGLIISVSGRGQIHADILGLSNNISGGTFTASDDSDLKLSMNYYNTMTGVTITTSEFGKAEVFQSGSSNALTGLTVSASGTSFTGFYMPAKAYADTGRTVISSLTDSNIIYIQ